MQILMVPSADLTDHELRRAQAVCRDLLPAEMIVAASPEDGRRLLDEDSEIYEVVITPLGAEVIPERPGLIRLRRHEQMEQMERELRDSIEEQLRSQVISVPKTPDLHYVAIRTELLAKVAPIRASVFVKLGRDHYVKIVTQSDLFTVEDVDTYGVRKQLDSLYLQRTSYLEQVKLQSDRLARVQETTQDPRQLRVAATEALEMMHDAVARLGFSPEIQDLAKKAAELNIKAIGAQPHLASVLRLLRRNEGKYIASHSVMLGEIACAVAYAAEWEAAGTFSKLVLAAILHDLPFTDNQLARFSDLTPEVLSTLAPRQIAEIRLHPVIAAEMSRKLREIQPDIDRIILQHHERPDGTGFPRGLFHTHIDPLAACFIIAEDLMTFLLEPQTDAQPTITGFVEQRKSLYSHGSFKKILNQLKET